VPSNLIDLIRGRAPPSPRRRGVERPRQPIPPCFTPEQWVCWVEYARAATPGPSGYCADCTPEYQRRMCHEHRCLHPETTFRIRHGGIVGVRPGAVDNDDE
jgi:hypothetical protein